MRGRVEMGIKKTRGKGERRAHCWEAVVLGHSLLSDGGAWLSSKTFAPQYPTASI